jgi:hypothetical protein
MSRRINYFTGVVAPSCTDADVDAFFALSDFSEANLAAWLATIGKTYAEVKSYVCEHITTIKAVGITGGSNKALYLPIGNTAVQRRTNFWNPASFQLSFNGGITFTNFAIKGNGINGWTNTGLNSLTNASASAMTFSIDIADNFTGGTQVMGTFNTGAGFAQLNISGAPNSNLGITNFGGLTLFTGTTKGLFTSCRRAASGVGASEDYRENISLGSTTLAFTPHNRNFYLNARNSSGTAQFFCLHGVNYAFLSDQAWTDTQAKAHAVSYATLRANLGIP